MEKDKSDFEREHEKKSLAFSNALKASGLQASLLVKFFRWNNDHQFKRLIESVDGGIDDKVSLWDLDTRDRIAQRWSRDSLRTQSSFMMSQCFFVQYEESQEPPLEGDLSLIVNVNKSLSNANSEALYSAIYEICNYNNRTPSEQHNWFGTVLKFWRGNLDTLRVNRILAGKSGNTAMHREVNDFLRALERVHVAAGMKKSAPKKARQKRKAR